MLKKEYIILISNIRLFFFYALFCFPLFPINWVNALFISWSSFVVFEFFVSQNKLRLVEFKNYGLFILPFMPYLLEWLLYPHHPIMSFELEKKLLLFVAPVSFFFASGFINESSIKKAKWVFILSVSVLSFWSFFRLIISGKLFLSSSYLNGAYELRSYFEDISGQHPTYFSMMAVLSFLWLLHDFFSFNKTQKTFSFFVLFLLANVIVLVSSKMPLIILMIGVIWVLFKNIHSKKNLWLIYSSLIISSVIVFLIVPSFKSRISEVFQYFQSPTDIHNNITERDLVFICNKEVFKTHWLSGVGARDAQTHIDMAYFLMRFPKGLTFHLNSHNQFLTLGICYGLGGLILFSGLILFLWIQLRKYPDALLFLICISMMMLSESILERQMGIYFFLFFGLLFMSRKKVSSFC